MISGCLAGWRCGADGTDYGMGSLLRDLLATDRVRLVPFCPEDHALGTPRPIPDLHDGDGFDALAGRARVLDPEGKDLTEVMLAGAQAMVARAITERVRFAILTDMSAACGTQVISLGGRLARPRRYQRGAGVAAAALAMAGVPVVSQRDLKTLALVRQRLGVPITATNLRDHHEDPWVREHLPARRVWPG